MTNAKQKIKLGQLSHLKKVLTMDVEKCEVVIQDEKESESRRRRFRQIKIEKEVLIEAIDCYTDKLAQEIKDNK